MKRVKVDWRDLLRDGVQSDLFLRSEEAAEGYVDERLDGRGLPQYLDSIGSVRGLSRVDQPESCIREFTALGERLLLSWWPYGS